MCDYGGWSVEVFLAMSEEQAKREGCRRCMSDKLLGSRDIYHKLDEIPEELCITRILGWEKQICLRKADFLRLAEEWELELSVPQSEFLQHVEGDNVWLIGFDD